MAGSGRAPIIDPMCSGPPRFSPARRATRNSAEEGLFGDLGGSLLMGVAAVLTLFAGLCLATLGPGAAAAEPVPGPAAETPLPPAPADAPPTPVPAPGSPSAPSPGPAGQATAPGKDS